MAVDEFDPETLAVLDANGFDAERFEELRTRVAEGVLAQSSNIVGGTIVPAQPSDVIDLPAPGDRRHAEAFERGLDALRSGRVAHVVLAGGMATRFGGLVKGVVEVFDSRSFLEISLGQTIDLRTAVGCSLPIAVMTSFATDEAIRAHVAERELDVAFVFRQFAAPRLRPGGGLFRDENGRPSLYGPGHGDLPEAIGSSGTAAGLRKLGVEHVVVANVDNLGARVDPVVLGVHLAEGRPLTLEVSETENDVGAAPVRLDGRLVMLEGPRFPPAFDASSLGLINTNTAVVDLDVFEANHPLGWLYVEKRVENELVVQIEHLYHELSFHVPATFLKVPRRGPRGRFFPIKEPEDLERSREAMREMLERSPLDS